MKWILKWTQTTCRKAPSDYKQKKMNYDKVDEYLISNLEFLKETIAPLKQTRNTALLTDPLFSDEIKEQYKDRVIGEVAFHICLNIGCSFEDAVIRLEEIKVEYLLE